MNKKYFASTFTSISAGGACWSNYKEIKNFEGYKDGLIRVEYFSGDVLVLDSKNVIIKIIQEQEENEQ